MNQDLASDLPSHEVLSQLAKDDLQAFEALRSRVIGSFIESAPERQKRRLRGIQFQVDAIRQLSRTPLAATVKIYRMMWESFFQLNDCWQDFAGVVKLRINAPSSSQKWAAQKYEAKILAFPPRAPAPTVKISWHDHRPADENASAQSESRQIAASLEAIQTSTAEGGNRSRRRNDARISQSRVARAPHFDGPSQPSK